MVVISSLMINELESLKQMTLFSMTCTVALVHT